MRKYHAQRDEARGLTTELCLLLAIAVIGTIAISSVAMAGLATIGAYEYVASTTKITMPKGYWENIFVQRLMQCGVFTVLAVVGTAIYQSWQLAEGGGRHVARLLGGTRVTPLPPGEGGCQRQPGEGLAIRADDDANRTRLLNIVEELAIATGIKPPAVFVLPDEPAINAFAAGLNEKDAVIGVTQGSIDRLTRSQLQGIVAHEFSHIKNGDMRLNIQILGVLTGVQAITLAARFLLRLGLPNGDKGKHPLGMVLALVFGAALWPIGQIGSLFATLIHLAVNRQREFLADASAVQYTRDPIGLVEALNILLHDDLGSRLTSPQARLASHLFFSTSGSPWHQLFQTHPPLAERIQRLEPTIST